ERGDNYSWVGYSLGRELSVVPATPLPDGRATLDSHVRQQIVLCARFPCHANRRSRWKVATHLATHIVTLWPLCRPRSAAGGREISAESGWKRSLATSARRSARW